MTLPTEYRDIIKAAEADIFRWWRWIAVAALLFGIVFFMVSCAATRELRHPCQEMNTCEARR